LRQLLELDDERLAELAEAKVIERVASDDVIP
jgi:hypothetical protein